MSDPFDFFDYPLLLTAKTVTDPSTNQSTGAYVPGSSTSRTIKGHVTDVTFKAVQQSGGVLEIGQRTLATQELLNVGDLVDILEIDTTSTTWQVKQQITRLHMFGRFGMARKTYQMIRVI